MKIITIIAVLSAYRGNGVNMNLYLIEYYDPELDSTDYTTVTANNEIFYQINAWNENCSRM